MYIRMYFCNTCHCNIVTTIFYSNNIWQKSYTYKSCCNWMAPQAVQCVGRYNNVTNTQNSQTRTAQSYINVLVSDTAYNNSYQYNLQYLFHSGHSNRAQCHGAECPLQRACSSPWEWLRSTITVAAGVWVTTDRGQCRSRWPLSVWSGDHLYSIYICWRECVSW